MRLKVEQLSAALQKALAPVYLVCGDEPLQMLEALDDIRLAAKQAGYQNREIINITGNHDWHLLSQAGEAISIFSEKKLLDLRLSTTKPGSDGSKVLQAYLKCPPEDTVLLISCAKLDSSALKSLWFQALDKLGVVVQVWPLQRDGMLQWMQRRGQRNSMLIKGDALKCLAALTEGNLLAAAQEIDKLYVLYGTKPVTLQMVEDNVADNARYDIYKLVDALLVGKLNRALKILKSLKDEGVAAPVVLWALSRELRILFNIKTESGNSTHLSSVWDKRKPLVQAALDRLSKQDLENIVRFCAIADQQIKGQYPGDSWDSLFAVCLGFVSKPKFMHSCT